MALRDTGNMAATKLLPGAELFKSLGQWQHIAKHSSTALTILENVSNLSCYVLLYCELVLRTSHANIWSIWEGEKILVWSQFIPRLATICKTSSGDENNTCNADLRNHTYHEYDYWTASTAVAGPPA